MDADRVDYPEGIALLALYPGYEFAVELMHREMEPNVRFFDNPARVVIDLFPLESSNPTTIGPFGNTFVLRRPIQLDLNGPGIPVDDKIEISGFGRPFEAAGLYRIWAVRRRRRRAYIPRRSACPTHRRVLSNRRLGRRLGFLFDRLARSRTRHPYRRLRRVTSDRRDWFLRHRSTLSSDRLVSR